MSLFEDINNLTQLIEYNRKDLDLRGISIGKVCYVTNHNQVKVVDLNSNQNYVSHWLKPVKEVRQANLNDLVLYSYPTYDLSSGIYFVVVTSDHDSIVDPGEGVTIGDVNDAIDLALTEYDILIKQWVQNQEYTTLPVVQNWIAIQNFVTQTYLTAQNFVTQAYLAAQNFATQAFVNTELAKRSSKYITHNFYNLAIGNVVIPASWIDKQVSFNVTNVAGTNNINFVINVTNNNWFSVLNKLYLRNTFGSTNVTITPQDGISINALAVNTAFSIQAQKQYEIKKGTSNTNYSITEVAYSFLPF